MSSSIASSKRRFTIRAKIISGYVFILLCLAASILIVFNQLAVIESETDYITKHDVQVDNLTNLIEKNMLDMETGQRGFVITGDDSYLEPYRSGLSQWRTNYNQLMSLLQGNFLQMKELDSIRSVIEEWLSISRPVVASKQNGDDAAVLVYYQADRGKQDMDQIRSLFDAFRTTEHGLTAGRLEDLNGSNESLRNRLGLCLSFPLLYRAWSLGCCRARLCGRFAMCQIAWN